MAAKDVILLRNEPGEVKSRNVDLILLYYVLNSYKQ